jgi:hypothetical protein
MIKHWDFMVSKNSVVILRDTTRPLARYGYVGTLLIGLGGWTVVRLAVTVKHTAQFITPLPTFDERTSFPARINVDPELKGTKDVLQEQARVRNLGWKY